MTRKTATMATGRRCTGRGCQPVSDFTQCDQRVLSLPVLWAKLVAHQLVGLSAEERGDRPGPAVEPHVGDLPGFVQAVHTRELPDVTVHRGVKHHHVCLAEPADDAERRGSRYLPDRLENDTHQLAAGSGGRQDRGVERYVGRVLEGLAVRCGSHRAARRRRRGTDRSTPSRNRSSETARWFRTSFTNGQGRA
jgi:hypothetical protein